MHELLTKYGYSLPADQEPFYTMSSLREVPVREREGESERVSGWENVCVRAFVRESERMSEESEKEREIVCVYDIYQESFRCTS